MARRPPGRFICSSAVSYTVLTAIVGAVASPVAAELPTVSDAPADDPWDLLFVKRLLMQQDFYALGSMGSNDCPPGYTPITSDSVCQAAAGSLSLSWSNHKDSIWQGVRPAGCFQHVPNGVVHNNVYAGGVTAGNDKRLCEKADDPGHANITANWSTMTVTTSSRTLSASTTYTMTVTATDTLSKTMTVTATDTLSKTMTVTATDTLSKTITVTATDTLSKTITTTLSYVSRTATTATNSYTSTTSATATNSYTSATATTTTATNSYTSSTATTATNSYTSSTATTATSTYTVTTTATTTSATPTSVTSSYTSSSTRSLTKTTESLTSTSATLTSTSTTSYTSTTFTVTTSTSETSSLTTRTITSTTISISTSTTSTQITNTTTSITKTHTTTTTSSSTSTASSSTTRYTTTSSTSYTGTATLTTTWSSTSASSTLTSSVTTTSTRWPQAKVVGTVQAIVMNAFALQRDEFAVLAFRQGISLLAQVDITSVNVVIQPVEGISTKAIINFVITESRLSQQEADSESKRLAALFNSVSNLLVTSKLREGLRTHSVDMPLQVLSMTAAVTFLIPGEDEERRVVWNALPTQLPENFSQVAEDGGSGAGPFIAVWAALASHFLHRL